MPLQDKPVVDNFDDQNLQAIQEITKTEKADGPVVKMAFTMVQINSCSDVQVSEESRKNCARALLK